MENLDYRLFYRRHLPHFQPPGSVLFITFRLAKSIPSQVLEQLSAEVQRVENLLDGLSDPIERSERALIARREFFGKWDTALHCSDRSPIWLQNPRVADLVQASLYERNGRVYDLEAFCIMPNHVHLVCTPLPDDSGTSIAISRVMHSLKLYTARRANHVLGREGEFWQHENFDHAVRDEAELGRVINYVVNNPVSAGLVSRPQDWPWTFTKYGWP